MTAPLCLDTEVRQVPGFPTMAVTAGGDVYGPKGRRKAHPDRSGYFYVSVRLPGKVMPGKLYVHRAVLEAWVGPAPDGLEAAHRDGDQSNNAVGNLRWATHVENCGDKHAHGTMVRGVDQHSARLTEADVREIRRLGGSVSGSELGRRFGVSKSTALDVVRGRTWRHLA